MATKKKVTRKKAERRVPQDDTQKLLAYLHETYDFGPTTNRRLANAIKAAVPVDPMKDLPKFIVKPYVREERLGNFTRIFLGPINGHNVVVEHYDSGLTVFIAGCRLKKSAADARSHWPRPGGISEESGLARPSYPDLIDWVERLCKYRGWTW